MEVRRLRKEYAGYAPGTEFRIIRWHTAAVYTASPLEDPFRAITVPVDMMEEKL